jgi:hypothetical protein
MSDLSVSYDAAGPVPKTSEELRADLFPEPLSYHRVSLRTFLDR